MLSAFIRLEQRLLRKFIQNRDTDDSYTQNAEEDIIHIHIETLEHLHSALPHLVPSAPFCRPTLWHRDLHGDNVFTTEAAPFKITSLIDWQWTSIQPLFLQVVLPKALLYWGKLPVGKKIPLPPNWDTMSVAEKETFTREKNAALAHAAQESRLHDHPLWRPVVVSDGHQERRLPFDYLDCSWAYGLATMEEYLLNIYRKWCIIATDGTPCPFMLTEEDEMRIEANIGRLRIYERSRAELMERMHIGPEGMVSAALDFEEFRQLNEHERKNWDVEKSCGPYPLQDGGIYVGL
jgi:hypothetical protein